MKKRIMILDDRSDQLGDLVKKLSEAKFQVRVCFSPQHVLDEIKVESPHLLIAASDFPEMTSVQLAEKAFESKSIPSFVVLDNAGDTTQFRMRRHPGIIGTFYKPLKVQKVLDRAIRFLKQ